MLESLLGSVSAERVLMFLHCRGEGYARQIARFYGAPLRPIQRQLEKLEGSGVLWRRDVGRTRLYAFNPRYPFAAEVSSLLAKAVQFLSEPDRQSLSANRRRPRRTDKPL
jgi:hypothetical protein